MFLWKPFNAGIPRRWKGGTDGGCSFVTEIRMVVTTDEVNKKDANTVNKTEVKLLVCRFLCSTK
jgi:hypothetical protein